MTERVVNVVDDDEDFNVVNRVGFISTSVRKSEDTDEFAKDARELKSLSGTSAVFKRRVSNEIRKFQRGDGAESKQVVEKEFLSGYDTFDVVQPPYNLDYLVKLLDISSPHYASVQAKVSNIVGLGFNFVETPKTKRILERVADNASKLKNARNRLNQHRDDLIELMDTFNEEDEFLETLIKVWRDYETTGNGYIEIGRKKDGTIGYIGHVPSQTIRVRRKRDGFIQISGFEVQFFAQFGHSNDTNPLGGGTPNEIIHLKKHSPSSSFYGVPDIIAAKQAVAGNEFAARYNLDFFENMAVPRHIIILKGAKLGAQAETALLTFLETGLKGQNHRSLYIPLPGDTADNKVELTFEKIMSDIQDSSFTNYRKANKEEILMVHRVPESKISVSANASLALAKDADKTFKEQVCQPEQRVLEKKLNKIIKEFTDAFELKLNEMSLTDEDTQSKIDERDRKSGIKTSNEVRTSRGMAGIEGGDELFDLNGKVKEQNSTLTEETTNRQRDSARSAGGTDSNGAARNAQGEGRATA